MPRKALIVGINYYEHGVPLFGCVDDAHAVKAVLERHGGGDINFDCTLLTGTGPDDKVDRIDFKDSIDLERCQSILFCICSPVLPIEPIETIGRSEPHRSFFVLHNRKNETLCQSILFCIRFPILPIKPTDTLVCPKPHCSFIVLKDGAWVNM